MTSLPFINSPEYFASILFFNICHWVDLRVVFLFFNIGVYRYMDREFAYDQRGAIQKKFILSQQYLLKEKYWQSINWNANWKEQGKNSWRKQLLTPICYYLSKMDFTKCRVYASDFWNSWKNQRNSNYIKNNSHQAKGLMFT
jgi:hypothetical protein